MTCSNAFWSLKACRPDRLKMCSGDRGDHMEMFQKKIGKGRTNDRDRPDRQQFYPGDRDDRQLLQAINWKPLSGNRNDRVDPKRSQNTTVCSRFNRYMCCKLASNEESSDFNTFLFWKRSKSMSICIKSSVHSQLFAFRN